MSQFSNLVKVFFLLILFSIRAYACSCDIYPPEEEFTDAEVVFAGKVISIREDFPPAFYFNRDFPFIHKNYLFNATVTLEVSQSWKGEVRQRMPIRARFSGMCSSPNYVVGEEFLVYGHKIQDELWTTICTNSGRINLREDVVTKLGKGQQMQTKDDYGVSLIDIAVVLMLGAGLWMRRKAGETTN